MTTKPTRARGAKATAAKARAKARAAGAKGAKLTQAQRALRDAAILACAQAGQKQTTIAKDFGLSERQIRTVVKQRAEMPSLLDRAPGELLEEMIANLQQAIIDFETMAYIYAEEHPSAALAAKRGSIDARDRLRQLLESAGQLPTNLQLFRAEAILRGLADDMVQVVGKLKAGEIDADEAAEFFRSIAANGESQQRQRALPAR